MRKDYERSQEFAEKYGWPKREFEPEISEHPTLLYYSGVWEIVSSNTERGKISLTNSTSRGMGSATGIGIDNTVTVNFEFTEPKTIKTAIRELYTLHGLFELSLAQRQRYEWIDLELTHRSTYGEHELPESVRLYWSLCNDRVKDDPEATRMDNLLAPDRRAEGFAKVASGWMNSADILGDPRERFATAFFQ